MFQGIPIIGLSGGVGSGKSFVAAALAEAGCVVIDSDELVRLAYDTPEVVVALRTWWGEGVFRPDGGVNRRAIAERVFVSRAQRTRLEQLLHPIVARVRQERMSKIARASPKPKAFVWDSPLLFETGLNRECDAVLFVDTPMAARQDRVLRQRGWTAEELARRENSQMGLDIKRQMSNYSVVNTADAEHVRGQVQQLLPQILLKILSRDFPGFNDLNLNERASS